MLYVNRKSRATVLDTWKNTNCRVFSALSVWPSRALNTKDAAAAYFSGKSPSSAFAKPRRTFGV
jgi:hypothetical protein